MPVGGEAVIVARVGHRNALHDQAPVAHDHAAVLVVTQRSSLELYSDVTTCSLGLCRGYMHVELSIGYFFRQILRLF